MKTIRLIAVALVLSLFIGCEPEQDPTPVKQTCMEKYDPYFYAIAILYQDGKIDSITYHTISDQYMKEFIECKQLEGK